MTTKECKEVLAHVRSMVKFKRQAQHLGLRELMQVCGASIGTLSRIERGHSMDAETFLKLIEWLTPTVQYPPRKRRQEVCEQRKPHERTPSLIRSGGTWECRHEEFA